MKVHADIRAMFHWAVKRGLLDINPAAGMDEGGAAKARKRFLSDVACTVGIQT
jgi:hypothetical protein